MGIKHLGAGFMHGRVNLGPKITIDSSIRLSIACAGICFKYMYASSLLAGRTGLVNSSKSHIPIAHHYSTGLCKSITCVTMIQISHLTLLETEISLLMSNRQGYFFCGYTDKKYQ